MTAGPTAEQRMAAVAQGRTDIWMPPQPRRAATVALLRDSRAGLEVYLVKRAAAMNFAAATAYPGGALEPQDGPPGAAQTLRRAAVREVWEETGVQLAAAAIKAFARWITPEPLPVRFDTEFFAAALPAGSAPELRGTEADEGEWFNPAWLLTNRVERGVTLLPPTLATLHQLAGYETVATALAGLGSLPIVPLLPAPVMDEAAIRWQLLDARTRTVITDPAAVGIPDEWRLDVSGERP